MRHGKNGNSPGSCDVSAVGNVASGSAPFHSGAQRAVGHRSRASCLACPKARPRACSSRCPNAGLLANTDRSSGYGVGNLIFETSRRHRAHSTLSVVADEALAGIVEARGIRATSRCATAPSARPADAAGQQAVAGRDVAGRPAAGFLLLDGPRLAGPPRRRGQYARSIRCPCSRRRPTRRRRSTT